MNYDLTDKKILAAVRCNSAKNLREYAADTGVPKSTVHERLRRLSADGVRFVPIINFAATGHSLQAIFLVQFNAKLLNETCVNAAFHVTPNLLLLVCVFQSVREIEEFRTRAKAASYYNVVDVIKCEGFVPPS